MEPTVFGHPALSVHIHPVGIKAGNWHTYEYAHATYCVGSNKVLFHWPKRFVSYVSIHENMADYLVSWQTRVKSQTPHISDNPLCPPPRKWQPTPVLLPEKSHGQRRPVGYSPWSRKELEPTERLHFHFLPSTNSPPWICGTVSCLINICWTELKWANDLFEQLCNIHLRSEVRLVFAENVVKSVSLFVY